MANYLNKINKDRKKKKKLNPLTEEQLEALQNAVKMEFLRGRLRL